MNFVSRHGLRLLICTVALTSEAAWSDSFAPSDYKETAAAAEVAAPVIFPKGSWGLALSGGGLRAGATSLGVLQELTKVDDLANFVAISSVSGGGYPIYGILTEMKATGKNATEVLMEDGAYVRHADRNSRMIPKEMLVLYMAIGLPTGWLEAHMQSGMDWYNGYIDYGLTTDYVSAVSDTFLNKHRLAAGWSPYRLSSFREQKGFPIPIFNTSSLKNQTKLATDPAAYTVAGIVELSPQWIGGKMGYWSHFKSKMPLAEAMVASAAAPDEPTTGKYANLMEWLHSLRFLAGEMIRINDGKNNDSYLLTDGGLSDNTGVLTLINHGCENILALDATYDTDASFADIAKLRLSLSDDGWTYSDMISADGSIRLKNVISNSAEILDTAGKFDDWHLPSNLWSFTANKGTHYATIWVMKLGISSSAKYPLPVTEYLEKSPHQALSIRFPMPEVYHLSFGRDEFRAYRFMGKSLVDSWLTKVKGELK